MAQKKVILKDGQDEIMPKTLASMVFTESGQTVENALKNTGGGGTGGIDEEQLAQYLQQHEYINQSALDEAHYLKPTSAITGYSKASNYTTLAPTDTLNEALGKLEAGLGSGGTVGGDDVYYLPGDVAELKPGCSEDEFLEAFGGEEGINGLETALNNSKRIYIRKKTLYNLRLIPVSCYYLLNIASLTFLSEDSLLDYCVKNINISSKSVRTIYIKGYELDVYFFALTSSSDSDEISTAVGGESGLKDIIQAVSDGNRLVIRDVSSNRYQDLLCSFCEKEDNGDMNIILSGIGYGLWGGMGGLLSINYTKSSNTFSCTVVPISIGS